MTILNCEMSSAGTVRNWRRRIFADMQRYSASHKDTPVTEDELVCRGTVIGASGRGAGAVRVLRHELEAHIPAGYAV